MFFAKNVVNVLEHKDRVGSGVRQRSYFAQLKKKSSEVLRSDYSEPVLLARQSLLFGAPMKRGIGSLPTPVPRRWCSCTTAILAPFLCESDIWHVKSSENTSYRMIVIFQFPCHLPSVTPHIHLLEKKDYCHVSSNWWTYFTKSSNVKTQISVKYC